MLAAISAALIVGVTLAAAQTGTFPAVGDLLLDSQYSS
jgi:hypothetical protein